MTATEITASSDNHMLFKNQHYLSFLKNIIPMPMGELSIVKGSFVAGIMHENMMENFHFLFELN